MATTKTVQTEWLDYWFAPVVRHCSGNDLIRFAAEIREAGNFIAMMQVSGNADYTLTIYRR